VALECAHGSNVGLAGNALCQILRPVAGVDGDKNDVGQNEQMKKSRQLLRKGGTLVVRKGTRFLLHYTIKVLRIFLWELPVKLYGTWVVLGAYGLGLVFVGYSLELVEWTDLLWYAALWLYVSRWRWNWQKLHRGIRPLYERRDDI
jgi:hypothetical protein